MEVFNLTHKMCFVISYRFIAIFNVFAVCINVSQRHFLSLAMQNRRGHSFFSIREIQK